MINQTIISKVMATISVFLLHTLVLAQVGINTDTPRVTLDIKKSNTPILTPDGLIPPRLTADFLASKDSYYGSGQTGAMVYVTKARTGTATPKTANVGYPGLYYFDGTIWQEYTSTTSNVSEFYTGTLIIPPHGTTTDFSDHSNTEYDTEQWWVISKTSTNASIVSPFTNPSLTVEYEFQGFKFAEQTIGFGTVVTSSANATAPWIVLVPNFISIREVEGRTRLKMIYIAKSGPNAWDKSLTFNVMLLNPR